MRIIHSLLLSLLLLNFSSLSHADPLSNDPELKEQPKKAYDKGTFLALYFPAQAQVYFQRAIELGNKKAIAHIGMLYITNNNSTEGHELAKIYFEAARSLNDPWGYIGLGHLYADGLGVKKNYRKAHDYYRKAASMGETEALWFLAYLKEKQLPNIKLQDVISAYIVAAKSGITSSVFDLIRLYSNYSEHAYLTQYDLLLWSHVHQLKYPAFKIDINQTLYTGITKQELVHIKKKAKIIIQGFSAIQ